MLAAATPLNAQTLEREGQSWNSHYTAREWLQDCAIGVDKCQFFILTVAQASYWFDKCIPSMTRLTEIEAVMGTFLEQNRQYVDLPATIVLLNAIRERWSCDK
jgi:hypothetical protein